MTLGDKVFAAILAGTFISMILYVIFGQITVRKLRKNPETKHALGVEFASGWDIFNVAGALALPKVILQRLRRNAESSGMGGFEADYKVLYKHTTVFDRVLAQLVYWSWSLSAFAMFIFMIAYFIV